ncbi:MAG: hypothetical protein ACK47Y_03075 [Dolichospermum sp.]
MLKKLSVRGGNREQGTGNREQGTGNREQGTVLTVWISSIFLIRQRILLLFFYILGSAILICDRYKVYENWPPGF